MYFTFHHLKKNRYSHSPFFPFSCSWSRLQCRWNQSGGVGLSGVGFVSCSGKGHQYKISKHESLHFTGFPSFNLELRKQLIYVQLIITYIWNRFGVLARRYTNYIELKIPPRHVIVVNPNGKLIISNCLLQHSWTLEYIILLTWM